MPTQYPCDLRVGARASVLPVLVALSMYLCPSSAAADAPPCPSGTPTIPPLNGSFSAPGVNSHAVEMVPCETMVVQVSGFSDLQLGAVIKVEMIGQTGMSLYTASGACYGPCVFQVPVAPWAPLRGTRGPISLVSSLKVTALYVPRSPLIYTLNVIKTPRAGYNIGGLGFNDAPLLTQFPRTVYGSFYPNEVGQYFRVRLAAGGTLSASGFAEGNPQYGSNLYVFVYRPDGTEVAKIVNAAAFYGRKAFTSSVYTNTSSEPGEFYIRVFCSYAFPLWDLEMTIEAEEGPRLTLFLDANPSESPFNKASPTSEHTSYVPGASLNSGLSVALVDMPQRTQLIAAYLDSAGQVVAPPPYAPTEVTFALSDTSAFKGAAMNWGTETTPDFSLASMSATFQDDTARVYLFCHDYGGFTVVSVSDRPGASAPVGFRIPLDTQNNNWLPDVGWKAGPDSVSDMWDACFTMATCDTDYLPLGEGTPEVGYLGDGFTRFEEFRGVIVRGTHQRLNPIHKNLFISSYFVGLFWNVGIYYAYPALPTSTYRVNDTLDPGPDEYHPVSRVINTNYENYGSGGNIPGHADQRVLRVIDGGYSDAYGCAFFNGIQTCADQMGLGTPNEADKLELYTEKIIEDGREALHRYTDEELVKAARAVLGHEVGHGLNIDHRLVIGCVITATTSLMDGQALCAPSEGDPGASYLLQDIPKMRLHFRF